MRVASIDPAYIAAATSYFWLAHLLRLHLLIIIRLFLCIFVPVFFISRCIYVYTATAPCSTLNSHVPLFYSPLVSETCIRTRSQKRIGSSVDSPSALVHSDVCGLVDSCVTLARALSTAARHLLFLYLPVSPFLRLSYH